MKWYEVLAAFGFVVIIAVLIVMIDMRVSASELVEPEASEVLEVSGSTSMEETPEVAIVHDEQIEGAEGDPIVPEVPGEDMQNAQSEVEPSETEYGYIQSGPDSPDALAYETGEDVTLADLNYTLNSILFCIVLCMSCAFVFLICKMVFPLFRGGR